MRQRIAQRDKATKRMAEDGNLLEAQRLTQRLNVLDHRSSSKLLGWNTLGTPIPSVVQIDQPRTGRNGGKPGDKLLMIQPRATVQKHTWSPVSLFHIEEFCSIDKYAMLLHSRVPLLTSSWEEAGRSEE